MAKLRGCVAGAAFEAAPHRADTMTIRILNELLLFSCLVALVTGIVLAAAGLLI